MKASDFEIGPYDMCPCGSGKKFKFCCATVAKANRHGKFPIGTVALYGPDNKTTTKIAAGVVMKEDAEAEHLERWMASDVTTNPKILAEIKGFFAKHGVKTVVVTDGNLGCPHEEGIDFKMGHDCPICHYWAGKQGTAAGDSAHAAGGKEERNEEEDQDGDIEELDGSEPFMTPEQEAETEKMIEESLDRSDAIVEAADGDFEEACRLYGEHVKANLKLPFKVRLVTPFDWEEPYFLDGEEAGDEYEGLHRKMPSMDDTFQLMKLEERPADWSMFDGEIGGWVVRTSDGKGFSIGLGNLEPGEEDDKSANAELLNDYGVWISDVNIGLAEQEGEEDEDEGDEEDEGEDWKQ
jgi:hypothetical protein